ncbi:MAG: hypothetical protein JW725_04855 [Candidatus Babeliaceae bacterium]|nr:hypothetical protein [Candidatus Babeliaceae bacterium]
MKTWNKFVIFIFAGTFSSSAHTNDHLDYVFAFDTGGVLSTNQSILSHGEVLQAHTAFVGATTFAVARAIQQNKIVVASVPLIKNLFIVTRYPLSKENITWWQHYFPNTDAKEVLKNILSEQTTEIKEQPSFIKMNILPHMQKNYLIFLAKTGDFIVLVPRGISLTQAGFLRKKVKLIPFKKIEATLPKPEIIPLSFINFKNLWNIKNRVEKHCLLTGHGHGHGNGQKGDLPIFGGLLPDDYHRFLTFLSKINCASLFVSTCFAGGATTAYMHQTTLDKTEKVLFNLHDIHYPIILGTTTDNVRYTNASFSSHTFDLTKYFDAIYKFTKKGNYTDLKNASRVLQGFERRTNIPSIRMPGANTLFRAISINNSVKTLTVTQQKIWELDFKDKPMVLPNVKNGVFLYYPAIVNIPLVIPKTYIDNKPEYPSLISMAQGKSLHIFKKIEAPHLTLSETLQALLGITTPTDRGLIIDELVCKATSYDGKLQLYGVVIESKALQNENYGTVITLTILVKRADNGLYYEFLTNNAKPFIKNKKNLCMPYNPATGECAPLPFLMSIVPRNISEENYKKDALEIINSTLPSSETIEQSSGQHETVAMVKKAAEEIIEKTVKTKKSYGGDKTTQLIPPHAPHQTKS